MTNDPLRPASSTEPSAQSRFTAKLRHMRDSLLHLRTKGCCDPGEIDRDHVERARRRAIDGDVAAQRSLRRRIAAVARYLWAAIVVMVALSTIVSGYGGKVNPDVTALPALMAMMFPGFLIIDVLVCIPTWWIWRKLTLVPVASLVICFNAIWTFMPLNIYHPIVTPENEHRVLKVMTYNTFGFLDAERKYPDGTNRTATAIINSGADLICVQEVGYIEDMPRRSLYDAQVDSINDVYPYVAGNEQQHIAVLSKYPLHEIDLPQPTDHYTGWRAAELDFNGEKTLVVSVHLQSLGLSDSDKYIYHEMTEGSGKVNWANGSSILFDKVTSAFKERASQARMLRHQIDSLGYANVIVCGDFNDISGCYAERTIMGHDMHSAFLEAAFGPKVTYNADRFYFNIDHVLFRGNMWPVSYSVGTIKSSDHYPVSVSFLYGE